ncbi:hypothetical protein OG439_16625 [Amycolatopsis sp. NBC_01307]|uniref:hypothetical protein n=1 Tax=Amycolatopsis sp. NBC_01307 TaxID=2903561 RepID=UPI002E12CBFA|nr:hypothetical protein OG439_16625 [Amycolatopsis sp. NBC_01307]
MSHFSEADIEDCIWHYQRSNVEKLKLGPVEAEWEELDEAERDVAADSQAPGVTNEDLLASNPDFADMAKLAEISPPAAVLMSFQKVELETRKALSKLDYSTEELRRMPPSKLFSAAVDSGLVSIAIGNAMQALRDLRNRVSHESDEEVTKGRAIQYALIAAEAAIALKRGGPANPMIGSDSP